MGIFDWARKRKKEEDARKEAEERGSDVNDAVAQSSASLGEESIIPPQYEGLPSDVVEELWISPTGNSELAQRERARRERALEAIRANESQFVSGEIIGLPKIEENLRGLEKDFTLVVHQTWNDSADKIMNSDEYFGNAGLEGTALAVKADDILNVLPELDKPLGQRKFGVTHNGANSMVVMAIPKNLVGGEKDVLGQVDELLFDKFSKGEISQPGLPSSFVYGYYHEGKLKLNQKFKPEF